MADTVRLACLKALQAQLQAVQEGEDDYLLRFTQVVLGPIDAGEGGRRRAMVGIVPGREVTDVQFPLTYCVLPLAVEFRATWGIGDPPSQELAEAILGDIRRKVLEDAGLGGHAIDLKDAGSEITLNSFADKAIYGVAHFELLYRHATQDPRQPI